MTRRRGNLRRAAAVLLSGLVGATGCVHTGHPVHEAIAEHRGGPITVPPPGEVPAEMAKIVLPEYVIEPPDVLRIEVGVIERAGTNGDKSGSAQDKLRSLPLQPVWGDYTVRPDGTLYFGVYGSVQVAGYTLKQAAAAVRESLAKQAFAEAGGLKPENIVVILDVVQYNSKKYYVITDGGGYGEQVYAFPIAGSETVLDALSNIYGLPSVASKRNIWVARRCPIPGHPEQILPVDWVGITQHGITTTNYQVMPGDRIYVKAQRLVTIDTTLARVISPIERLFGVTLLGASTVNQVQGRGNGFGGQ